MRLGEQQEKHRNIDIGTEVRGGRRKVFGATQENGLNDGK